MSTYTKLRDGRWGIRVDSTRVRSGDRVQVRRKNGQLRAEVIDRVLWSGDGFSVCSILGRDPAPREWDQTGPVEAAYRAASAAPVAASAAPATAEVDEVAEAERLLAEARARQAERERLRAEQRERAAAAAAEQAERERLAEITREAQRAEAARAAAVEASRARASAEGAGDVSEALRRAAASAAEIPVRRTTPALGAPIVPTAPLAREVILAGASAEGSGALVGWSGLGSLSRSEILAALAAAGLPAEWAPRSKSATAHAGEVVGRLNLRGYVSRRAKASDRRPGERRRDWAARWSVFRVDASSAQIGEAAGSVVLTVELGRESDELRLGGDPRLSAEVDREYRDLRDGEVYQAGDVTSWLARLLRERCGATTLGVGYYVPTGGREVASRIAGALAERWGCGWIHPLLPVATSDELRVGIARGLADEVRKVRASLESQRETARGENRADVAPGVAGALLRSLESAQDRLAAYRILCGDDVIAPVAAAIRALHAELGALVDDASLRFALLDLSIPPAAPVVESRPAPAERAADAALAARRGDSERLPRPAEIEAEAERRAAFWRARSTDPTPESTQEPDDDSPLSRDQKERFGLLELD